MSPIAAMLAFGAVLAALSVGTLSWVLFAAAIVVQISASVLKALAAAQAARVAQQAVTALRAAPPNPQDEE